MRIVNQNLTVRSVLFSRISGVVYLLFSIFFIYQCLLLLPIWLTTKDKAEQAQIDYEKKIQMAEMKKIEMKNRESPKGQARYEKDFFNKLDEGENLIVLYSDKEISVENSLETSRKMFWWEEEKQKFLVWWRNLEFNK